MKTLDDRPNLTFYLDLFRTKYSQSRSFITEISEFGSLCVSIITINENTFAYCRSILGLKEFEFKNNKHSDEHILLRAVSDYFRYHVDNWDTQITAKFNFFDNMYSIINTTIGYLNSSKILQPLNDLVKVLVLANIEDFKFENLRYRFSEINYFYAEEIENFILKGFLDVILKDDRLQDLAHINDIEIDPEELDNLIIKVNHTENGQIKIIHEFISTELEVLMIMNDLYYDGVLACKEKLEVYKFNEFFKDFENFYLLSKIFVKDLIKNFDTFEYMEVDPTLADIYKIKLEKKKENTIKFKNDESPKNDEVSKNEESSKNSESDLAEKLYSVIIRNIDFFNNYKKFISSYDTVLKTINLKEIKINKITDTFNVMVQRLTKYNLLITRILSFTDQNTKGFINLKTFLIKFKKFTSYLNDLNDMQYRKEKTWELCIKYHLDDVKGLFIDEVSNDKTKLILLADYVLFVDKKGTLLDYLNVKNLDIHENGDMSLFLITNKKIKMYKYYEYEFHQYKMYVIKFKCLSKGIRDRFINNVRSSKKKYVDTYREISRRIIVENEEYAIPHLSQGDEEWILMKYRFIMNEVLKANEGLEFIDLSNIHL